MGAVQCRADLQDAVETVVAARLTIARISSPPFLGGSLAGSFALRDFRGPASRGSSCGAAAACARARAPYGWSRPGITTAWPAIMPAIARSATSRRAHHRPLHQPDFCIRAAPWNGLRGSRAQHRDRHAGAAQFVRDRLGERQHESLAWRSRPAMFGPGRKRPSRPRSARGRGRASMPGRHSLVSVTSALMFKSIICSSSIRASLRTHRTGRSPRCSRANRCRAPPTPSPPSSRRAPSGDEVGRDRVHGDVVGSTTGRARPFERRPGCAETRCTLARQHARELARPPRRSCHAIRRGRSLSARWRSPGAGCELPGQWTGSLVGGASLNSAARRGMLPNASAAIRSPRSATPTAFGVIRNRASSSGRPARRRPRRTRREPAADRTAQVVDQHEVISHALIRDRAGCDRTPRRRDQPRPRVRSPRGSRVATPASSVSPSSSVPPGRLHWPASGSNRRLMRTTRPSWTITAPTPTTGRSGYARRRPWPTVSEAASASCWRTTWRWRTMRPSTTVKWS